MNVRWLVLGVALACGSQDASEHAGGRDAIAAAAPVKLPAPGRVGRVSLEQALEARRSVRHYTAQAVSMPHTAQLLWAAQGITEPVRGLRTAPSAGGRFPIEVDVVITGVGGLGDGIYRYAPKGHTLTLRRSGDLRRVIHDAALQQDPILSAPLLVVLSGVVARTEARYGDRAGRYVLMEAGHVAQNVLLQAAALGLAAVSIGAAEDAALSEALGLSPGEQPIYVIAVGHPQEAG